MQPTDSITMQSSVFQPNTTVKTLEHSTSSIKEQPITPLSNQLETSQLLISILQKTERLKEILFSLQHNRSLLPTATSSETQEMLLSSWLWLGKDAQRTTYSIIKELRTLSQMNMESSKNPSSLSTPNSTTSPTV